jgi:hypothetical protein
MEVLAQYRSRAFSVQQFSYSRCIIKSLPHLERTNGMYNNTVVHTMEVKSMKVYWHT